MKRHLTGIFLAAAAILAAAGCSSNEDSPAPASFSISTNALSFTGYESTIAVEVTANRRWSALASEAWIGVNPDGYPTDWSDFTVNVAISVSDNDGEPREGTVTFYMEDAEVAVLAVKQDRQNEEDRPEDEFPITWANLQWNAGTTIVEGNPFEAGCCVFADGLTNAMESTTGEDIRCDIGWSVNDTHPSGTDWTWTPCWFNGDWEDNFYYQGRIENMPVGEYHYTFRVYHEGGEYRYAGTNGLYDGVANLTGTFSVTEEQEAEDPDIDYSSLAVTWTDLNWAASYEISAGEQFEASVQVFIEGLTNLETASVSGDEHVSCDLGYSTTSSDPTGAEGWTWTSVAFNRDDGNNWLYQGKSDVLNGAGLYNYTFRFSIDGGDYVYASKGALWDGEANVCGTFTVK